VWITLGRKSLAFDILLVNNSMRRPQRPPRADTLVPVPPDVLVTADTFLDPRGRPYISLSINYGDQRFFLLPKRGTTLDPDSEFIVSRVSPHKPNRHAPRWGSLPSVRPSPPSSAA